MDYITGLGFIGKRLRARLEQSEENGRKLICIPHAEIMEWAYRDCRHFYFLSTYGNMVGQDDVAEILLANVAQVGAVLSHLIDKDFACEHFVFVSSSSVTLPVQTPYSRSKRAAEEIILASGVPTAIVRPYSVTGVGEQKQHLIPTLIRSCFEGERMDFAPQPTHDWIDVSDVVDGLLMLANEKRSGIFELGSGKAMTNDAILQIVQEITGREANAKLVRSLRAYDDFNWRCVKPAQGWSPKKSLITSIREMVEVCRK